MPKRKSTLLDLGFLMMVAWLEGGGYSLYDITWSYVLSKKTYLFAYDEDPFIAGLFDGCCLIARGGG